MKEVEAGSRGKSNKNLCRYCGKIVTDILEAPWSICAQEFKGAERGGMGIFSPQTKMGRLVVTDQQRSSSPGMIRNSSFKRPGVVLTAHN
ncbi:hypothetical protein [Synechococcus sp. MIT S1220]|uniref:hypothetical protein n=1 Tax=Synechococcus sp. MIT S1220 TaxID=3082549 RepID=UPI0039B11FBB